MVILSLTEKGGEAKQLQFDKDEVTFGRVQGNDVVLPKGNVSKRHCRIFVKDGKFAVEDLKSTNGTYVNGRKIPDVTPLFNADKVYVGDFIVRVENAPSQEAANLGNEAGSLSTALGSRRPPPPPPRASQAARPAEAEPGVTSEPRRTVSRPIAPPPPPRRETRPQVPSIDESLAPPAPSDIDLDEGALATAPPRPTPPPPVHAPTEIPPPPSFAELDNPPASAPLFADRSAETGDAAAWLRDLLRSEAVTAVYIAGASSVEVERAGRREPVRLRPFEADALVPTVRLWAGQAGAPSETVVDGLLADGSRLAAVFPPVTSQVWATVTKRSPAKRTLNGLTTAGALSREMDAILAATVLTRSNILVAGDAHSGRAILEALGQAIAPRLRVVTAGAPFFAPKPEQPWVTVSLEARSSGLIHAIAALRPDHLIVDLTAAPVASDVLHESAYGQQGALVSLVARSATDALLRLEALAGPAAGTRALVESAVDLVVFAVTLPDGSPLVLELGEPRSDAAGRLYSEPLAVFKVDAITDGKPAGRFAVTNTPCRLAATLTTRGASVPSTVLRR